MQREPSVRRIAWIHTLNRKFRFGVKTTLSTSATSSDEFPMFFSTSRIDSKKPLEAFFSRDFSSSLTARESCIWERRTTIFDDSFLF